MILSKREVNGLSFHPRAVMEGGGIGLCVHCLLGLVLNSFGKEVKITRVLSECVCVCACVPLMVVYGHDAQ